MDAAQKLKDGDVDGAVTMLLDEVRRNPADAKRRVFLFQLSALTGNWARAKTQLEVAAGMDTQAKLMARVYGDALGCEDERRKVFAAEAGPTIFGDPQPWMAKMVQALRLQVSGDHAASAALRAEAFDEAPTTPGTIDGQRFEWLADADPRLGPIVEAVVNGRYFWIPMARIRRIEMEAPSDLRDKVWTPASFVWANGGESIGLIPTRYPGSEGSKDPGIRLAAKTDWRELTPDIAEGLGQRIWAADAGDVALLDVRLVEFDQPDGETADHDVDPNGGPNGGKDEPGDG